jgi:phosphate-selective porin OprO/OprP
MRRRTVVGGAVLAAIVSFWQSANAAEPNGLEAIEQVEVLEGPVKLAQPTPPAPTDAVATKDSPSLPPRDDKPKEESKTYPTVKVTGFFHLDSVWTSQDPDNVAELGTIEDELVFRRARLTVTGSALENLDYMFEMDFGLPGRPTFFDVFAQINELPYVGHLRVGRWRQPIGLESPMSARGLTFLERGLTMTFNPFRQSGVGVFNDIWDGRATWAVSTFRTLSDNFGNVTGNQGGQAAAGRFTVLPVDDQERKILVHLGGSYGYINPAENQVRFLQQPEIFLQATAGPGTTSFVDSGVIAAHDYHLVSLESAFVVRSFSMQAELVETYLRQDGGPDVHFSAMYALARYMITGEDYPYDRENGIFNRVEPTKVFNPRRPFECAGAWEIAARYSYLNLTDENIRGGTIADVTFGVNWYLNKRLKLQFNYIHAILERNVRRESTADIFALRTQLDF